VGAKEKAMNETETAAAIQAENPADAPILITLPEVCRLLSISKPTAYRMQKEGLLRAVHIPGRRSTRYKRAEVLRIVG
jgi:excisionase family DNA binding protein